MPCSPKCGSAVEGRFGGKGGPAEAAGGGPAPTPGAPPPPPPPPPMAASSGMQENVASALCYAVGFITGILFLVIEPYNKNRNIRFHAWQSIFFSVAYAIISILMTVLWAATWAGG